MSILLAAAAALASLNALPAGEVTKASVASVPFELDNGRIFVGVFVNGRGPYRFGFDTGASGMGRADSRLAAELSLPKVGETAISDGLKTATTDVVRVTSLRLGGLEKRDVELPSRDYNRGRKAGDPSVMGIIGRDFFADQLVTIDYPARTIRFAHGELGPGDAGAVDYDGGFVIPVCFGSRCYDGKIDTGSNRSLVLPQDVAVKVKATTPTLVGHVTRTNSVATLYEMTLTEPVRIGAITAAGQKVLYADPSDTFINIGSDFLKDYVLTIDQRNRRLRITQAATR